MPKISKFMTKEVVYVTPLTTVEQAAITMRDANVGALPVVGDDGKIGMITDRDIVVRGVSSNRANVTSRASDIMTENVQTCRDSDDVETAVSLMAKYQVRRLPVVNSDGALCGILSLSDLSQHYEDGASFALSEICDPLLVDFDRSAIPAQQAGNQQANGMINQI